MATACAIGTVDPEVSHQRVCPQGGPVRFVPLDPTDNTTFELLQNECRTSTLDYHLPEVCELSRRIRSKFQVVERRAFLIFRSSLSFLGTAPRT
jgi:hypothetical protein